MELTIGLRQSRGGWINRNSQFSVAADYDSSGCFRCDLWSSVRVLRTVRVDMLDYGNENKKILHHAWWG